MNLLGFIMMSLVYIQAVHGWLSAYERLVNSQNFFSPYLTQEDLSRLGRNYLQTGHLIEDFFPRNGVRYIAMNDGIDTLRDNNDIAPFKNILNEMYSDVQQGYFQESPFLLSSESAERTVYRVSCPVWVSERPGGQKPSAH